MHPKWPTDIKEPVIDTKALYTYLYPDVSEIVSTNYLIRQLGIYDQDIRRHRALGDSILIARIFLKLLEECNARGLQSISFDDLQVKRVKLDPLL
jgi:DNA polymerase III, alpha subunit (gram-positive type)